MALAVGMVALHGSPASAAGRDEAAPVKAVRCPAEAVGIERHARCGFVSLPLDRTRSGGKRIRVYFELYPRRNVARPALSTILSIEGGPGYPTTDDRDGRAELWRPVSGRRNLLLVDLRGTGRSGALACIGVRAFDGGLRRAGRAVRPSSSAPSAISTRPRRPCRTSKASSEALRLGKVDLYGDSYGSYAAQAFALRYPERLRSLVLDGTYPLPGSDPAASDLVAAGRRGLELTCRRSPGCPRLARQDPVGLVSRFVDRIRAHPIDGYAPDGDGARTRVRVNEDGLVQIFSSGYYFPGFWREFPAAILAARHGDTAPILRLGAETITIDAGGEDPPASSEGLYLAVTCHDYPQLWDPDTRIRDRPAELRRRLAAYPRGAFEPFSGTGLERNGLRGLAGLPPLAVPAGRRPTGPSRRRVSRRAHARPERRSRHDHRLVRGEGGRSPLPGQHLRRGSELRPRDGALRQGRLRVANLRPVRQDPRLRRHDLRAAGSRATPRAAVPGADR